MGKLIRISAAVHSAFHFSVVPFFCQISDAFRQTPVRQFPCFLQVNSVWRCNSHGSTVFWTFEVIELGSGVQISHLAKIGVEITARIAQSYLLTPMELPAAKSEVCTPDPEAPIFLSNL
jgi:hypothetical protein